MFNPFNDTSHSQRSRGFKGQELTLQCKTGRVSRVGLQTVLLLRKLNKLSANPGLVFRFVLVTEIR